MSIELVLRPLGQGSAPWRTALEQFEIGRDPESDLPFTGSEHDMVSWRHARLEAHGGRYLLSDLGSTNKTYLNNTQVQAPQPLSAGDQIRLGLEGPRIDVVRVVLPTSVHHSPTMATPMAPPPVSRAPAAAGHAASSTAGPTLWPVFAAVGGIVAVGCLVGAVLFMATKSEPTAPLGTAGQNASQPDPAGVAGNGNLPAPTTGVESPPAAAPNPAATQPAATSPSAPSVAEPLAAVREALRAVVAEHPDGKLTALVTAACAVDSHTLITTAGMAQELEALRLAGWKISAMHPVTRAKQSVEEILVHVGFDRAQGQPTEQIYFDQAKLVVEGVLPTVASLATADELAKIEQGYPLSALGFAHETGGPITRFDELATIAGEGKVLAVTSLQPTPEAPRLMHVQGDLAPSLRGSVVTSRQGKLVGVYAVETPQGVQPKITYCPLLAAGAWGSSAPSEAEKMWVPPHVEAAQPPANTSAEKQPTEQKPAEPTRTEK